MCIEFINKVREARFIKIKNRQVNKFHRLVAKWGREISAQSVNNSNQPQVLVITTIKPKLAIQTISGKLTYLILP